MLVIEVSVWIIGTTAACSLREARSGCRASGRGSSPDRNHAQSVSQQSAGNARLLVPRIHALALLAVLVGAAAAALAGRFSTPFALACLALAGLFIGLLFHFH